MNCTCAYYDTVEHNLLIILLLRTALAPYWKSLVHSNCACVYYNTLLLHKIETFSDWIRVYAEKLVNAPMSHKIEYTPMHTIRVTTRLASIARRTDRAAASSRLCLSIDYASTTPGFRSPASIFARRVITLIMCLGT